MKASQKTTIFNNKYILWPLSSMIIMFSCVQMISAQTKSNINVDFFRGQCNVSIPIYIYKTNNLSVPITLNYSPKVPELGAKIYHPGWCGLGWNVTTGGYIRRSVKGIPDEWNTGIEGDLKGNFSLDNSQYVPSSTFIVNTPNTTPPVRYDTDEDEFSFNFNGYSGTFLYYRGSWKIISDRTFNIKPIIYNISQTSSDYADYQLLGFEISTPDGLIYTFGVDGVSSTISANDERSVEFETTPVPSGQISRRFPVGWYLVKIESSEGDQITFDYEKNGSEETPVKKRSLTTYVTQECREVIYIDSSGKEQKTTVWEPVSQGSGTLLEFPTLQEVYDGSQLYISTPVYLKSISSNRNPLVVSFDKSTYTEMSYDDYQNISNRYKLDKIGLRMNDEDHNYREYRFSYSGQDGLSQLLLNSVQEVGISGTQQELCLPPYQFVYQPEDDYSLFPSLLQQITYPEGGSSTFEFEENRYDGTLNNCSDVAQGARIKKVVSRGSDNDEANIIDYYYSDDIFSNFTSGQMSRQVIHNDDYIKSSFFQTPTGNALRYYITKYSDGDCANPQTPGLSNPMTPPSQIGYSSVWEVRSKEDIQGNNTVCGSIQYTYHNYRDPITLKCNSLNLVGKLICKRVFDDHANMLESYQYQYTNINPVTSPLQRYVYVSRKYKDAYLVFNDGFFANYDADFSNYMLTGMKTEVGGISTDRHFTYDQTINKVREETLIEKSISNATLLNSKVGTSDAKFTTTTTTYKYMKDFDFSLSGINSDLISDKHRQLDLLVEKVTKKDDKIIAAEFTKYIPYSTPYYMNGKFVRPSEVYTLDISEPRLVSEYSPVDYSWESFDPNLKLRASYLYDNYSNLIQVQEAGHTPVTYLYDSNHIFPLLEAKGISSQAFHSNTQNLSASDPLEVMTMRKRLPAARITSYTYDFKYGVLSQTGFNGVGITNEYDLLGRLKAVKDRNGNILKTVEYGAYIP